MYDPIDNSAPRDVTLQSVCEIWHDETAWKRECCACDTFWGHTRIHIVMSVWNCIAFINEAVHVEELGCKDYKPARLAYGCFGLSISLLALSIFNKYRHHLCIHPEHRRNLTNYDIGYSLINSGLASFALATSLMVCKKA